MKKKQINYTAQMRKNYRIMAVISWLLCYGVCAFLVIAALTGHPASTGGIAALSLIKEQYLAMLYSFATTLTIVAVLSLIVKDKVEPTIWMVNIILSGYLFNMTVVYIIFGIWIIDNYVIKGLKIRYKNKYIINKEIDRRE